MDKVVAFETTNLGQAICWLTKFVSLIFSQHNRPLLKYQNEVWFHRNQHFGQSQLKNTNTEIWQGKKKMHTRAHTYILHKMNLQIKILKAPKNNKHH